MPVLVGGLARSGEAVPIVRVAGAGERSDPALEQAVREPAADFAYLGVQRLYDPRFARAVAQVARRHGVDVIHSHLNLANVASRVAAAVLGLPHVATIHLPPDEHSEDASRRVWADGLTARLSTRIVGVSPDTAQGYAERFRVPASRVRVIPNGTSPRPTSPDFDPARLRRELLGDPGARFVLCAARLEERKGVADLVAAAGILRRRVPDVHLVVAGKGPEEERLAQLARGGGMEDFVHLVGFRDDMGDLLAGADAYCLPSYIEGLPVSVLEAMWAGTPCVATRVGGTTFVVRDGETGLLAPPREPAALAAALERVLTEPELAPRLSARALDMVRSEFTPEKMSADYAALYREVVAGGRSA
jgi:glycosyltransferase involved in cell wall biosynthesis